MMEQLTCHICNKEFMVYWRMRYYRYENYSTNENFSVCKRCADKIAEIVGYEGEEVRLSGTFEDLVQQVRIAIHQVSSEGEIIERLGI